MKTQLKSKLFNDTVKTAFLITEAVSKGDIKEASNLRLLLNYQIDELLKERKNERLN